MGIDMKKEIKISDLWKRGPKEPKAEKPPKEPKKAKEPKPPKEKKERRFGRGTKEKVAAIEAKSGPPVRDIPLMHAFNLLPKEEVRAEKESKQSAIPHVIVALAGVLVFAALAAFYLSSSAAVTKKSGELDDLRGDLASLQVPEKQPQAPSEGAEHRFRALGADSRAVCGTGRSPRLGPRPARARARPSGRRHADDPRRNCAFAGLGGCRDERGRELLQGDRNLGQPGERRAAPVAPPGHPRAPERSARVRDRVRGSGRAGRQLRHHRVRAPGSRFVKKQIPIWPVIGLAILIVAAVAYMVVIRPKRAESGRLDEQIAEMQMKVSAAQLASRPQQQATTIKVADVFEVSKAMPDTDDMPGIILDLNSVAEATGIKFLSIQPSAPTPKTGYSAIAITLTFEGNYFDLTDFLFRLRNLVTVRDGHLSSAGRLFTLDTMSMKEGKDGFPSINAGLTVSAYVYGAPDPTAAVVPPPTTEAPPPPPADASAGGLG